MRNKDLMGRNFDELIERKIVAYLEIKMDRAGMMSIAGTITDRVAVLGMLDTARERMVRHFDDLEKGTGKIIVPGYDTALTGTEYEKKLLGAQDELHKARDNLPKG